MSLTESQGAIVDPPCQVAIVGMGPAGGLVARLLAEAGLEVTGLEMGPWRDARTFSSNEWEMRELWWPEWEYRLTGSAARGPGRPGGYFRTTFGCGPKKATSPGLC
jgi:choline dehydrogenase-like flavoprotein